MIERIANPTAPPLDQKTLDDMRNGLTNAEGEDMRRRMDELDGMEKAFQGRGDLRTWSPEVLDEIDDCFLKAYMAKDELSPFLFFPDDTNNLNKFQEYFYEVDNVLRKRANEVPAHTRAYFAYYSTWQMRGYKFPVPLGTRSVVFSLHKVAELVETGFKEVSEPLSIFKSLPLGSPRIERRYIHGVCLTDSSAAHRKRFHLRRIFDPRICRAWNIFLYAARLSFTLELEEGHGSNDV
jgi:hypothetical protein